MRMNVDSDESMVDKETQTEELNATFSVSDAKTHNEEFAVFPVSDTEALTEEFDYMWPLTRKRTLTASRFRTEIRSQAVSHPFRKNLHPFERLGRSV